MRTAGLTSAYDRLLAAAQAISPDTPLDPEQRADVNWTLCHVALSDELIADAAQSIRAGGSTAGGKVVLDNFPAMDPEAIAKMTASTTHSDRVSAVRQNATRLLSLLAQVPEESGQALIILRMHDRTGHHVSDTEMPWSDLVNLRSDKHIPAHADRLQGYLVP